MDKCKGQLLDISPQILFETGPQNPKPEIKHLRTKKGRIKEEESESTYLLFSNLRLPPPPSKPQLQHSLVAKGFPRRAAATHSSGLSQASSPMQHPAPAPHAPLLG